MRPTVKFSTLSSDLMIELGLKMLRLLLMNFYELINAKDESTRFENRATPGSFKSGYHKSRPRLRHGQWSSHYYRPWVARWLEHRTPDRKAWFRCPIPPNNLRVHTEYVLVKSVGPKVLWAEVQGTGGYFPPLQYHGKIVEVEIGGVAIYRPFEEFRRANSYCPLYGARGLGQRQAYFYPLATMNFVGLVVTTSDRWHLPQQQHYYSVLPFLSVDMQFKIPCFSENMYWNNI
ncbi:uncharacterized protein TNCV_1227151 [Trichonephila clavipes]|nr:uncharacterized protein TNCV_1227151 [Trichonephila clavipes]